MAGYFELYQDKAGQYRFRLKAGNIEAVKNAASRATTKEV